MNYKEAMKYLQGAEQYCGEISLEPAMELMNQLGNPQRELKIVHIGGTNGKGSIAAYCSTVLAAAGYRVGRYSSPTLLNYWERIQILERDSEGKLELSNITENTVTKLVQEIKVVIYKLLERGISHPTPFEIETAMAFLEFKRKKCDVVILEVGMGGRLDATNIIEKPECSVLASISMDHMLFLGNNLEKIAKEKCGIIKKEVPVISYQQKPEAMAVINQVCKERKALLRVTEFNRIKKVSHNLDGIMMSYKEYEDLRLSILGENQVKNAATALEVLEQLKRTGYQINREHIYEGFSNTNWPGRFCIVNRKPMVIVDGAHNADAAQSLKRSIELYLKGKNIHMIIGVFADKDYKSILKYTVPNGKRIYTINAEGERSLPSEKLAQAVREFTDEVEDCGTVEQAWNLIKSEDFKENDVILCFGSLSFLYRIFHICKKEYSHVREKSKED